jgi:hypothetical protein
MLKGEDKSMEGLGGYKTPQKIIQGREIGQTQDHNVLEGDEEEDSGLLDLLHQEGRNVTNACILDESTIIIYLKKRVGDSHDVSKPAKDWVWEDMQQMEVPIDDPQDLVGQKMSSCWQKIRLKPHDSNLNRLEYGDCYRAAIEDENHTLYLMAESAQTEGEKASENSISWVLPPSATSNLLHWDKEPERIKLHKAPQAHKRSSLKQAVFNPPATFPALVKFTSEVHWDKIWKGPDLSKGRMQNMAVTASGEDGIGNRKKPDGMKITRQPSLSISIRDPSSARHIRTLFIRR